MSDNAVGYILLQNYKNQGYQPFGRLRTLSASEETLELIERQAARESSTVYALAKVEIVPKTPETLPTTKWWDAAA